MNQAGQTPIVSQPRRWDVLASFMLEQNYRTFVELGCKEGRTTSHILKTVPDSRVVAVDPWMADPAPNNGDATREDYKAWDFTKIAQEFWANVGTDEGRCTQLRMTGVEALQRGVGVSSGETFDLVFIDALHDYDSVFEDIALWWPKVRVGGMLAGHDFNHKWPGVERAVADSFNLMHIGVASDSVWFIVKVSEEQYRGTPNAQPEKAA